MNANKLLKAFKKIEKYCDEYKYHNRYYPLCNKCLLNKTGICLGGSHAENYWKECREDLEMVIAYENEIGEHKNDE